MGQFKPGKYLKICEKIMATILEHDFLVVAQAVLIHLLAEKIKKNVAIRFCKAMEVFGLDGWRYTLIKFSYICMF